MIADNTENPVGFDQGPVVPPGIPNWQTRTEVFDKEFLHRVYASIWPDFEDERASDPDRPFADFVADFVFIGTATDLTNFHFKESRAIQNEFDTQRRILEGDPEATAEDFQRLSKRRGDVLAKLHELQDADARSVPGFDDWYASPERETELENYRREQHDKSDASEMAIAAHKGDFEQLAEHAWIFQKRRETNDFELDIAPGGLSPVTASDAFKKVFGGDMAERRMAEAAEQRRRAEESIMDSINQACPLFAPLSEWIADADSDEESMQRRRGSFAKLENWKRETIAQAADTEAAASIERIHKAASERLGLAEMTVQGLNGPLPEPINQPRKNQAPAGPLPLVWANDIAPELDRPYVVKNLLGSSAMSVVYGQSNVGKSFFVIDLAGHVAAGRTWRGMRVQPGTVVYVAAEGGASVQQRIWAWCNETGRHDIPLAIVPTSVNLLDPRADTQRVIDAIVACGEVCQHVSLVVIDTLSRSIAGGDENSSKDMTAFVANVDRIREREQERVRVAR